MLSRLDIGADSFLRHLVIQDNLAGIAIQRHALPNTVFDGDDNLSATGETDRTLGCTTVRVELAYGMLCNRNGAVIAHRRHDHSERPVWGFYHGRRFVLECDVKTLTCKNLTRRGYAIQENGARVAVIVDNQKRCRMVGGFKRQRHAAFVICSKRFKRGYGKLSKRDGRLSSRNNGNVVPIGRIEGDGCPVIAP